MGWKFFSRLAFISHCCAASNVAVISLRLESTESIAEPGSDCSAVEIGRYINGMEAWTDSASGNVAVDKCTHLPSATTTTTIKPTREPTWSSATIASSVVPAETTTSVQFTTTTELSTSTTTPSLTAETTVSTTVASTPVTTVKPETTVIPSTSEPATSSSTRSTTKTPLTSSATALPTTCPAIPPPLNPLGYTDEERNAYCASADGKGSYCKCSQTSPGRLCQTVPGGSGLHCDCSSMCEAPKNLRMRLLTVNEPVSVDVFIVFNISTDRGATELLESLQSGSAVFIQASGLPETASALLTGFQYTQGSTQDQQSGVIYALLDLTIESNSDKLRRRLSESDVGSAVSKAIQEVILFPEGTVVTTTMTGATANVSMEVPSDLEKTEQALSEFLVTDAGPDGKQQLPTLISAYAEGVTVAYAPGFVPIVWTSNGPSLVETALNISSYVLAGIGVVVLVLIFLLTKYRMVIRSFLKDVWHGRWRTKNSGGWTMGKFAAFFLERDDKSDISSTPATATNVDQDEFDDLFLRELDNMGAPMSRPSNAYVDS